MICSFPSLPEGGILEAVITVVEPLPGTLLFDASVSSSMDPNPSNDFGTIEVIVDQELVCVEGARVRFQQLDWLTRDGGVRCECSQIGVARFRLRKKAEQCLDENGGCYVNLTTAASSVSDTGSSLMSYWSVRNLYLTYPDKKYMKRSRPSVQFGLPLPASPTCDQCLGELFYGLEVTSAPLTEPTVPPNERAKVKEQGYLVGGFEFCGEIDGEVIECSGGGGSDDSDGPETPQPADCVDPAAKPVKTARISVPSKKLPKIDVDKTSCAAGAAAIGIDYITRGTKIKTDKARKIHDDLSPLMKIDEGGGVGTNPEDMLSGKEQYVDPANKDLPISSSLILEPPCNDEPMGALDDGCALEVFLEFDGKGSHVALVTQITGFDNGQCKITYVDDPNQGNGKKEIAEHVIVTGPTDPRKYAGGKVVGFLAECLSD